VADDRHPLAQNYLPVRIVEHADDLHGVEHPVAGIGDVAGDFDNLLVR